MNTGDLERKVADGLAEATRLQTAGDSEAAIENLSKLEGVVRPSGNPGLTFILIQKAGWLRELGRLHEARSALAEAEGACRLMPAKVAPFAELYMEQGIIARQAGDLPRAESLLKEARSAAMGSPIEVVVMSDVLANLSSVYADQGRPQAAQSALLDALKYDQKTKDPRAHASNLNMLGLLYKEAGDRKTARIYLTWSKNIAAKNGLAKELMDAILNLAIVADEDGEKTEAKLAFQSALDYAVRAGRRSDIATVKCSLGVVAAREGKFAEARIMMTEAFEMHSALGRAEFSARDLINLTQIELCLDNPRQALEHAQEALSIVQQHGLMRILWVAHYCVARTQALVVQRRGTSNPTALHQALDSYCKAADAIEILRAGIGRPEESEQLLVDKETVYGEGMLLAGMLGHGTIAWTFSERARGRSFLDSLGAERIAQQASKHPLSVRRADLTTRLIELADTNDRERQALMDELRLVRSLIRAQAPTVAALTETELPDIQEVAAAIPPDTVVVEFFRGPLNLLTVFVLNQGGLAAMHTVDCGDNDLQGLVDRFRSEVQYGVPNEPTGNFLWMLLFGKAWNVIATVNRLLIVPHRELHYIPMAALWFDHSREGPERLYLCQRFQISVLPSASYLVRALKRQQSVAATESLVIGNPTQDLPGAEAEAIVVAKLLKVKPVLHTQALRECVLRLKKMQAVIHIASHGVYDDRDPMLSGVLLADGRLSVEDLLDAHIPADLLTLSGCLTGISSQEPGDELVGLARAALAAGIPSTITTLWEVPDESSREFFTRFYSCLLSGMNKDEALGTVQRAMLADKQYSRPANWAPYVLIGNCGGTALHACGLPTCLLSAKSPNPANLRGAALHGNRHSRRQPRDRSGAL